VKRLRERDARARTLAQVEFERPILLRAGAGTGKTQVLVARVVAWCLGPGWSRAERALGASAADLELASRVLERVVAITFTEAAAAEMETRIAAALGALARGAPQDDALRGVELDRLPKEPQRGDRSRALLAAFDALTVRTIHAFCRRVLAQRALEADLHPSFDVDADLGGTAEVVRDVLLEKLRTAFVDPDPAWLELVQLGVAPNQLEDVLLALLERAVPEAALRAEPFAEERVAAFREGLASALVALREAGLERLCTLQGVRRTTETAAILCGLPTVLDTCTGGPAELDRFAEALRERFSARDAARLADWARGSFNQREEAALEDSQQAFSEAAAAALAGIETAVSLRARELDATRRVLLPLLARARERLRARGLLGYDDLLVETQALLEGSPASCAAIRAGIEQLLVDEFQDTDALQCTILERLALDPGPRRPGLFAVGDPQQSIYGWRSADLLAYVRFRGRLEAAGGVLAELCVNHRSVPSVLDAVRSAVAPVLREQPGVQPAFAELLPSPALSGDAGFERGPWKSVEYWNSSFREELSGGRARSGSDRCALEAAALADDLVRLHREARVAWRDVAVLMRSRGDLDVYLEALRERGVPYAVEGDRAFYRRREVIDALSLVRAVVDPMDQVSLCGWLRSPAVGVPDAAWIPLAARGVFETLARIRRPDPETLLALERSIREAVLELDESAIPRLEEIRGFEEVLIEAVGTLAELRASFAVDPPDRFVELLRARSMLEPTHAARHLGEYRLANLERFFRELVAELCDAAGDARRVLRGLRRRQRAERLAEEARVPDAALDAVRVLTIHGAKGLDFEHVYLVQTHRKAGGSTALLSQVTFDPWPEYAIRGAATLGRPRARAREAQVASAEAVRLLYVALTRAKRRLVVISSWQNASAPPPPERAETLQGLLLHRPDLPDATAFQSALVASGAPRVDRGGVRFVALDLGQLELAEPARRRPRAEPALPDPFADVTRLRALAQEARARMELRFGCPASAIEPVDRPGEHDPTRRTGVEGSRAAGTAIHRALEALDLELDSPDALARLREETRRFLDSQDLAAPQRSAARTRADEVLARLGEGRLLARLRALRRVEHYRELPLLAPPGALAVGYRSGVIDLLYRDPDRDEWVVVDYKTDRIEDEADLEGKLARYAPQAALYAQAVQGALGLSEPPRVELWWLDRDQSVELPPTRLAPAATLARP
jgi:ATP-dependent exoDNAse (exonuclease V) beta subunit